MTFRSSHFDFYEEIFMLFFCISTYYCIEKFDLYKNAMNPLIQTHTLTENGLTSNRTSTSQIDHQGWQKFTRRMTTARVKFSGVNVQHIRWTRKTSFQWLSAKNLSSEGHTRKPITSPCFDMTWHYNDMQICYRQVNRQKLYQLKFAAVAKKTPTKMLSNCVSFYPRQPLVSDIATYTDHFTRRSSKSVQLRKWRKITVKTP